jgi:hypothetical protein
MRGIEPFAQFRGQRCGGATHSLETLPLAYAISINGRLVFEVERDRAEDLGQSERIEFFQNRFWREAFIKALDDGVKHWTMESRDTRVPAT